ncbi:FAD-dependent monooxygenase [Brevibacterium sp. FAM 25378]|uniref:FAD-dependent monooxygenase n=1 Tax=unclassified Brevibacterium TaxID=2614124 RepID=UPI003211D65E
MATVTVRDLPVIDTEVLVVGAGPSGLMAGLVLARRRIPAVVIDSKSGPTRESRAVAVQARSMEIYDQLGIVQEILDGGNPAARMQIGQDAGLLGFSLESTQSGSTDFPGIQIFEQSRNEELLSSALDEAGASVRWQCRLVAVINNGGADDGSVEALAESPDGLFRIRSRWCIGADGAGSTIRQEIGASFEGVTNGATFYVADLYGVSGLPENTLATRFGDTSFAVLLPLGPDGHGRIISMVPGESIDQETALARAQSDLGISHTHVDWFSSYRVHHRVASRFRRGAMFLVGDAGHVHSPVGGQGMNTGLQDSHNLANLLADVAHEHVDQQSLDRYEKERRPVAIKLVKVTDRAFGVIARRGRGIALMRRGIGAVMARLAPKILRGALGARAGGLLGQYRIRYHFLPAETESPGWANDTMVGLRLPRANSNLESLRSFTWQLHSYGGSSISRPDVPSWFDGPYQFGPDIHRRLHSDRLYIIRPDGYVAASVPIKAGTADQEMLRSALRAHRVIH